MRRVTVTTVPRPIKREIAARVVALATEIGDVEAAKHFGISARTVARYRAKLAEDTELSALVAEKTKEFAAVSEGWAEQACRFMSSAIDKLNTLVQQAGPEQMRDVVGAIKIVGELEITRKVLGGEQPSSDSEGAEASQVGRPGALGATSSAASSTIQ